MPEAISLPTGRRAQAQWLDAYMAQVWAHVNGPHRQFLQGVFEEGEPPLIYTVGRLYHLGAPELAVMGLPLESAGGILNQMTREEIGRNDGEVCAKLANFPLAFRVVHPDRWTNSTFATAVRFYTALGWPPSALQALQMVWPDPAGKFPWEAGWDRKYDAYQPKLWEKD